MFFLSFQPKTPLLSLHRASLFRSSSHHFTFHLHPARSSAAPLHHGSSLSVGLHLRSWVAAWSACLKLAPLRFSPFFLFLCFHEACIGDLLPSVTHPTWMSRSQSPQNSSRRNQSGADWRNGTRQLGRMSCSSTVTRRTGNYPARTQIGCPKALTSN